jgi:uncharacterized protein (TIGR02757 family)
LGRARSDAVLRRVLDAFLESLSPEKLIQGDPIELVRRYSSDADQEVAGLLVAALAYGRVASIKVAAERVLSLLGPTPSTAIQDAPTRERLGGFMYRFQRGDDLPRFLSAIAEVRDRHGSLAAAFATGLSKTDADYAGALDRFVLALRAAAGPSPSRGLLFLMPRADGATGSAKRLFLYLRWMVRESSIDLGTWNRLRPGVLDPAKLVIPLDTHIQRISGYIGLTDRQSPGLATAKEITHALARLRPDDPLHYEMALCHLGISGACPRRRDPECCHDCPIRGVCRLGAPPPGWR